MYLLAHFFVLFILIWLSKYFELSTTQFAVVWGALMGAALIGAFRVRAERPFPGTQFNRTTGVEMLAVVTLLGGAGLYLHLAGPYLEVPADVFAHLEYMQGARVDLVDGAFTSDFRIAVFSGPGNEIWYYLFAVLTTLTATEYQSAVNQAGIANVLTLLVIIYAFSTVVFAAEKNRATRMWLALFSVLIFFLTFGTNIFAFVRYYALAPTTLNLALYFSTIALLLRYLPGRGIPLFWLSFVSAAMLIAWLIHEQEAIFIYLIGLGIACYSAIDRARLRIRNKEFVDSSSVRLTDSSLEMLCLPWWFLAVTGLVGLAAVALWSHLTLDRFLVTDTKLLSIQNFLPTRLDLYVLNPFRQFYETIALPGVLIYIFAVILHKWIRQHPYLLIGLLSPLATVFNPLFADFFLRHSSGESFWRFCYLIPVAFVASLILVRCSECVKVDSGRIRFVSISVAIVLVVAMLLPTRLGTYSTWNRWPTLAAVKDGNGIDQWQDLIDYVATLDIRTRLYTDPVTGYMLTGMTTAQSRRKKFHRYPWNEMSLDYLTPQRLRNSADTVVIINLRDGIPSVNGELSRHWPQQITLTSAYYSGEVIKFITDNPDKFALLWEQDGIGVYRVVTEQFSRG